jgi:hypothetical protein
VLTVSDELGERDPALAQLAAAAVSGLAPAGPERRRRPIEVAFDGRPGVVISAPPSVREAGFSLDAATRAGPADEQGREALLNMGPGAGDEGGQVVAEDIPSEVERSAKSRTARYLSRFLNGA